MFACPTPLSLPSTRVERTSTRVDMEPSHVTSSSRVQIPLQSTTSVSRTTAGVTTEVATLVTTLDAGVKNTLSGSLAVASKMPPNVKETSNPSATSLTPGSGKGLASLSGWGCSFLFINLCYDVTNLSAMISLTSLL